MTIPPLLTRVSRFRSRLLVTATIGLGALALGAPAFAALPQQSGSVDLLTQANVTLTGGALTQAGYSVAGAGDVNADGIGDIIVGAPATIAPPWDHALVTGPTPRAIVIYGSAAPININLDALSPTQGFSILGTPTSFDALGGVISWTDGLGSSVAGAGDVNNDGIADVIVGAFTPTNPSAAGHAYVIFGRKTATRSDVVVSTLAIADGFAMSGIAEDSFGMSVAGTGDVNGDGFGDVVIGAESASPAGRLGAGEAYVIYGSAAPININLADPSWSASDNTQGFSVIGGCGYEEDGCNPGFGDNLGYSVAGVGDVNHDGLPDIGISAIGVNMTDGSGYVVFGSRTRTTNIDMNGTAAEGYVFFGTSDGFTIHGVTSFLLDDSSELGTSFAGAGDINGDGIADVAIGAPGMNCSGETLNTCTGVTYVVYGSAEISDTDLGGPPWTNVEGRSLTITGDGFTINGAAETNSGQNVAGVGDINGDGYGDIAVSTYGAKSYVVYGAAAPINVDLATFPSANGIVLMGSDTTTMPTVGVGDINGDGHPDLLAGDVSPNVDASGAAYAVFGFNPNSTSSARYATGITGTIGTAITSVTPTVARTGTATFAISPALPAGLALSAATGTISGTPTVVAAATTYTISMTDLTGTTTSTIDVAITAQPVATTPITTTTTRTTITTTGITQVITVTTSPTGELVTTITCTAADGTPLTECTVELQGPAGSTTGQSNGVEIRKGSKISLGKTSIKAKGGKQKLVVPVVINATGRKTLQRNLKTRVTIIITTKAKNGSTGTASASRTIQLPTHTLSPVAGIFDTLSTTLNDAGTRYVSRLAQILPTHLKQLTCTGYADSYGAAPDNVWLGQQRATTLCTALQTAGVKATKTKLVSLGASDPRATNSTSAGRLSNRRAAITITY